MHKILFILLVIVFFTCTSQGCKASDHKKKTYTSNVEHNAKARSSSKAKGTSKRNKLSFKSSPYNPSGLLLHLDFENERVKPAKGKKDTYDLLELRMPSGQQTSVGIMYEGGNEKDRYARIVTDPINKDNRVFHYWLKNARIPYQGKGKFKGRIQLNLGEVNKTSIFQRYRIYLHPDLNFYRQYPNQNTWFIINEFWMGARWKKHPFPFRIGVNIAKPAGAGKPLYFAAGASISAGGEIIKGKWKEVWSKVATNFEVPVGEWLDIEIGYKQGDNKSGHFYMGVKRENDKKFTKVFDITDWTYHPESPEPVPLTDWQPLKIYTSSRIIDFVRQKNGVIQMYWDDFEAYKNW